MNLYDQLKQLTVIPEAFTKWKDYREEVTRYLMTHAYGEREIALFGAGRCNDIDIKMLTACFEKVYLIDKDEEAMTAALNQYSLVGHPRVQMKVVDFTGLDEADYREYASTLVSFVRRNGRQTDTIALANEACSLLEQMEQKMAKALPHIAQYDNVAAIGVHSQLISMLEWIWTVLLQTLGKNEDSVRTRIISMNDRCVERFNDMLLMAARYHCITGDEVSRVGALGAVQGAMQGMRDIEKRRKQGKVILLDETSMVWPFHEEETKAYQMKFMTLKKN